VNTVAFPPPPGQSACQAPLIPSVPPQSSAAHPALAARQSCQCQPLFVRPKRGRLDRMAIRTRAQDGDDIKEEVKEGVREVKGFFTGNSNAVSLSPILGPLPTRLSDFSIFLAMAIGLELLPCCRPVATLRRTLLDSPTYLQLRYESTPCHALLLQTSLGFMSFNLPSVRGEQVSLTPVQRHDMLLPPEL
jgi:hypothetical protein